VTRALGAFGAASALFFACGTTEGTVSIVFPNARAHDATKRLQVETRRATEVTGASDCDALLQQVAAQAMLVDPDREKDVQLPFTAGTLDKVPSVASTILVRGYGSIVESAPAVLAGCVPFDPSESKDVEVALLVVLPDSAEVYKASGDRQVGRRGDISSVPLVAGVQAIDQGTPYAIPGVEVAFAVDPGSGFRLEGASETETAKVDTDEAGLASISVRLPSAATLGHITASVSAITAMGQGTVEFTIGVTEPSTFTTSATIALGRVVPVAIALGHVMGAGANTIAFVGCNDTAERCSMGQGATMLAVLSSPSARAFRSIPIEAGDLGISPSGLSVADLVEPAGKDDVAILDARRKACAPSCEGSEVLILRDDGQGIGLAERRTLTASNAIGLVAFTKDHLPSEGYANLAVAAKGRSPSMRPCVNAAACLMYDGPACAAHPESCGCPPGQSCECSGCASTDVGHCVTNDQFVDLLIDRRNTGGTDFLNLGGCQAPILACDPNHTTASTCSCGDAENEGRCATAEKGCDCLIPDYLFIGSRSLSEVPHAMAAGILHDARNSDLAVAASGLVLFHSDTSRLGFANMGEKLINGGIDGLAIALLDADTSADVVFYARAACTSGAGTDMLCPIFRPAPADMPSAGCLGAYVTAAAASLFNADLPDHGACRRYHLPFIPDAICTGQFNHDTAVDVAIASRSTNFVAVFSGDGQGGLLDPPDMIALPAGLSGGPIACDDLDGDGLGEIVVAATGGSGTVVVVLGH
jgi:hypothetical protein